MTISLTKTEQSLGWAWWACQLLFVPSLLREINGLFGMPLSEARLNFLLFLINFVVACLILRRFIAQSCRYGMEHIFSTLRAAFFGFVLYRLVSMLMRFGISRFFPSYVNQNDHSLLQMLSHAPTLLSIGIVFLAPVAEELLYRGVIFGSLSHRSRLAGYAVSAALFSLVHILGYRQDPVLFVVSFINYLPAGLLLAWAYERSGSILAPVLMHIAINQIGMSAMR